MRGYTGNNYSYANASLRGDVDPVVGKESPRLRVVEAMCTGGVALVEYGAGKTKCGPSEITHGLEHACETVWSKCESDLVG